jgi:hypothetical protein
MFRDEYRPVPEQKRLLKQRSLQYNSVSAETLDHDRNKLFIVIPSKSHSFSSLLPVNLSGLRSQSTRWLSVPFVWSLYP